METKIIEKTMEVNLEFMTDKMTMESLSLILNFISHASKNGWEILLVPVMADLIAMTYENLKNSSLSTDPKTVSGHELLIHAVSALDRLSDKLKHVLKDIENDSRTH